LSESVKRLTYFFC